MNTMASQITSLTIVYSIFYFSADQRKHQSSALLAFVRGIHRRPMNSPHKGPVTRKMFPFDDVIMDRMLPCQYAPFIRLYSFLVVANWTRLTNPTNTRQISHNAPFVTEICTHVHVMRHFMTETHVHISVTKRCIVGYGWCIVGFVILVY